MPTLSMPAAPGFRASRFGLIANTQTFRSPLDNTVQTLELTGARWRVNYELPPMTRAQAAACARVMGGSSYLTCQRAPVSSKVCTVPSSGERKVWVLAIRPKRDARKPGAAGMVKVGMGNLVWPGPGGRCGDGNGKAAVGGLIYEPHQPPNARAMLPPRPRV